MNGILLTVHGVQEIYCVTLANIRNACCGYGYSGYTICSILQLDTKTKGSMQFRNLKALGCSISSAARVLLRA